MKCWFLLSGHICGVKAVGMDQTPQGSGHSPELKQCSDSAPRVWVSSGPVCDQELDSMGLVGSPPTWLCQQPRFPKRKVSSFDMQHLQSQNDSSSIRIDFGQQ